MLKMIQKSEEGQVPRGKELRIEGRKTRVTRKEFQRLKEEFHDTFMAQIGMCHLMEQRIRGTRRQGMEESERVARECEANAEEELWSGWIRLEAGCETDSQNQSRRLE